MVLPSPSNAYGGACSPGLSECEKAVGMRSLLIIPCLATMSSLTWAQAEVKTPQTEQESGAVTFADLDGFVLEARVTLRQVIRRGGRQYPVRAWSDTKLAFGPGARVDVTLTSTSHHPRGVSKGRPRSFSVGLERAGKVATTNMGDGYGVWVFGDGMLTSLRTYTKGAFRRDIAFARSPEGIPCRITEGFAREQGTGAVVYNSPVDGVPEAIVSSEQVSSTCRVTRPNSRSTSKG